MFIYDYAYLEKELAHIIGRFPSVSCRVIGKSLMGRNLYELRVGQGDRKVHFNASFHANEWITSLVLMKWFQKCLANHSKEEMDIFKNVTVSIVPMVNPDGIELLSAGKSAAKGLYDVDRMNGRKADFYSWKANIRGVDLNKQFPAGWESYKEEVHCKHPYYRDFPGERPLSEPEAIAMKQLVEADEFDRVIALHTQGKEFYWGYEEIIPAFSERLNQKLIHVSSYKPVRLKACYAGFRDWFVKESQKCGYTLELGKGINPLPISQLKEIKKDVFPMLDVFLSFW